MSEDNELRLRRANVRIAELEQKNQHLQGQRLQDGRLVIEAKKAVEEAISFSIRFQNLGLVDPTELDKIKRDMQALRRYFQSVHNNIVLIEQGLPVPESEQHESIGNNTSEGRQQGNTGKERKTNRRKAAVRVDDTGGEG